MRTLRFFPLRRVGTNFRLWEVVSLMICVASLCVFGCDNGETGIPFVSLREPVSAKISGEPPPAKVLRIAGAPMISPIEGFTYYQQLLQYISLRLDRAVQLIQRRTYYEINELLRSADVGAAFICSGAFLKDAEQSGIEILAVPHAGGSPTYRSYVICHARAPYKTLKDLHDTRFAFTDPLSLSGRFYLLYRLRQLGETPDSFFSKIVYSGSHDNSIRAVVAGEVDAACVDSLVYDYMRMRHAAAIPKTKLLEISQPLGIPPFVASPHLDKSTREALRDVLLNMRNDPDGRTILENLRLDGFYPTPEGLYDETRAILKKAETP